MIEQNISLSIILVNCNTRDYLRNALESIYEEIKDINNEIFVVDNASSDGSAEMVRSEFPGIILIRNDKNLGFAKANNQAILQARGKYFFLINPDTIVLHGTLHKMINFMENNFSVGALGCSQLDGSGNKRYLYGGMLPGLFKVSFNFLYEAILGRSGSSRYRNSLRKILALSNLMKNRLNIHRGKTHAKISDVDLIDGCGTMIRKSIIEQVGSLDEEYFHGKEDAELCIRIKKAGWKLHILNDAQIIHYGMKSYEQFPCSPIHAYNGEIKYLQSHYGRYHEIIFKLIALLSTAIGILINAPLLLISPRSKQIRLSNIIRANIKLFAYILGILELP